MQIGLQQQWVILCSLRVDKFNGEIEIIVAL
jgi:hypothetical protein